MKGKNVRNPIDVRIELDRKSLRRDIRMVLTHLVILAVISGLTAYLFYKAGFPTPGLIVGTLLLVRISPRYCGAILGEVPSGVIVHLKGERRGAHG